MSSSYQKIAVAITGASGSIYAERLVQILIQKIARIYLMASPSGEAVAKHELKRQLSSDASENFNVSLLDLLEAKFVSQDIAQIVRRFGYDDLFAPIASGSSAPDAMVVIPASMGTVARIAHGLSSNLIERSADVVLKERRKLIIVPRETPLSSIHLRNLLMLSEAGAEIIPAMPAFYNGPKTVDDMVDFVVARVLNSLRIDSEITKKWNPRMA